MRKATEYLSVVMSLALLAVTHKPQPCKVQVIHDMGETIAIAECPRSDGRTDVWFRDTADSVTKGRSWIYGGTEGFVDYRRPQTTPPPEVKQ